MVASFVPTYLIINLSLNRLIKDLCLLSHKMLTFSDRRELAECVKIRNKKRYPAHNPPRHMKI